MSKKPKVLFIAPAQSSKTTQMILEEAKKEFDCSLVPIYEVTIGMNKGKIKIMHKGKELKGYDYIFPRIDGKRAKYGFDIISAFDYTGVNLLLSHAPISLSNFEEVGKIGEVIFYRKMT